MPLTAKEAFAAALKQIREEKGLSQMEVVRRTGLDRTTIPRYERAKLNPTLENAILVAEALEMKPGEFVEEVVRFMKSN